MIRFLSLSLLILLFPPGLAAQSLADTAPRIISSPTLEAVAGQAYTYQIQCTGDPAPTYRLAKGPGTMVLDAGRGRLIWTPTRANAGPVEVTVEALNNAGTDSQSFTITVMTLPQFGIVPPQTAMTGREYRYTVPVDASPAAEFSLVQWPEGMTIGASSGELVWTPRPDQTGVQNVSVSAHNKAGTKVHTFVIDVTLTALPAALPSPSSFALLSLSPQPLNAGDLLSLHLLGAHAETADLVVRDLLGRTVLQRRLALRDGKQTLAVDLHGVTRGLWLLELLAPSGEARTLIRVR